uniref:Uncharacterized protein n=1 Tax=Rhizophora mucronata TaxID=61149 RepID=A0A2P2QP13_RHIMU
MLTSFQEKLINIVNEQETQVTFGILQQVTC